MEGASSGTVVAVVPALFAVIAGVAASFLFFPTVGVLGTLGTIAEAVEAAVGIAESVEVALTVEVPAIILRSRPGSMSRRFVVAPRPAAPPRPAPRPAPRPPPLPPVVFLLPVPAAAVVAVSYTHLTLPTICSV